MSSSEALFPGTVLLGRSRTITDAEVAFLPALMGAINPLFHDEVRAQATAMGGRILYGPAVLGIGIALTEHLLSERVVALLEITSVRFRRPVRTGTTLTAQLTVRSNQARQGKPGRVIETDDLISDQAGETVLTFHRRIAIKDANVAPGGDARMDEGAGD